MNTDLLFPPELEAGSADEIRIAIHPKLCIAAPAGNRYTLLGSIYLPEQRSWAFRILDEHGRTIQISSLLGYRILGPATEPISTSKLASTPAHVSVAA
jgi:hypothetical protein